MHVPKKNRYRNRPRRLRCRHLSNHRPICWTRTLEGSTAGGAAKIPDWLFRAKMKEEAALQEEDKVGHQQGTPPMVCPRCLNRSQTITCGPHIMTSLRFGLPIG